MRHALLCLSMLTLAAACGDLDDKDADDTGANTTNPQGDDDDDDDDDDGVDLVECEQAFSPCGGDPTGTWDVGAVCRVPLDTSALGCGNLDYDITGDRSSGSITLAAGGVYDRTYQVDIDFLLHVPEQCFAGPINCGNVASLSSGFLDECTETGTGLCDCTGSFAETDAYIGTWSIEGGDTIVTDNDERHEFCVQGNRGETLDEDGGRVIWVR